MAELEKLVKELSETNGVSGFERAVRRKLGDRLAPLSDEILRDRLGGIVGRKTGLAGGPRILIAGHLDEVGWMVTHVTEKGFLRIHPLGGWWTHVMLSQKVSIQTHKGEVTGLIGSKPPHALKNEERKEVVDMRSVFIDIGARSRQEAEEMGVRPGDPVVPVSEFFTMRGGELWAGKALDNRAGCALALEVLKRLQDGEHPNVLYAGATVQEEVGSRGAATLASLVDPDIAFALDVGVAMDTPGLEGSEVTSNVDGGPLMFIYDAGAIAHEGLRDLVRETAAELGLPLQVKAMPSGGTDAARFHLNGIGCPSIGLGFAVRYIHSHVALMSRRDFEQAAELLTAVIRKLHSAKVRELHDL